LTIAVLDYGMGNLHSVARAIVRAGGAPEITADPDRVAAADALVIPGVGHFGACMGELRRTGLAEAATSFILAGGPVFAVCVGMQVLLEGSEEDGSAGLGLIEGVSRRLPDEVKVPHMGWNTLSWNVSHPYATGVDPSDRFYFVHSYAPTTQVDGVLASTEHGSRFASVIARDNVFGTQFHPEKSGVAGIRMYANFVATARAKANRG
jgi:glutamine amidotransferase